MQILSKRRCAPGCSRLRYANLEDRDLTIGRSRLDRMLTLLVGAVLLAYYGLIAGGHHYSIDGIVMFESAKQLLFHRTFVLDPPVQWGRVVIRASMYGIGLTLGYVPALTLLIPFSPWLQYLTTIPYDPALLHNPALYTNDSYLFSSWINPLITAATGCFVLKMARQLGLSPAWSVGTALMYGFASPAAAYARFDLSQPLAALGLTGALFLIFRATGPPSVARRIGAGAYLGVAVLSRPELSVVAVMVVAWVLWTTRSLRESGAVAAPIAMAVAVNLAVNWIRFGDPRATGYGSVSSQFDFSVQAVATGVLGLTVGPSQGILLFFPLAWLAVLGLIRLAREDGATGSLWIGLFASCLVLYGAFRMWWGGWSWGPRFLTPVVPMLTVASALWAAHEGVIPRTARRALFFTLGGAGVVVTWTGILFDYVEFYAWVERTQGPVARAFANFSAAASPLVSGWTFLTIAQLDLLWLRTWNMGGGPRLVGAIVVVVLTLCLVWSARRLCALLQRGRGTPAAIQ